VTRQRSEQEDFWAGDFGSDYVERNNEARLVAANTALFSKALSKCDTPSSVIEFGANVGLNLRALQVLFPQSSMCGIEINNKAASALRDLIGSDQVFEGSILDYEALNQSELVLIKGVLIHINPELLQSVYQKLYDSCSKYLLICEYYSPSPVSVTYRGHGDRLFKRDFAGEMLDMFDNLSLLDYGFVYRRDPAFPLDDVTWFLLRKW
jgi:spore coat polysaccharide biosynthesis protein SpsF